MTEVHSHELHQIALRHFNEPMLAHHEVVRCIGYGETAIDCYFIAKRPRGRIVWLSCVGGYTFLGRLKGQGYVLSRGGEEWDDLYRLDSSLGLNGCTREESFRLDLQHDDEENHPFPKYDWSDDLAERVGRAWASIDGKLHHFIAEKGMPIPQDMEASGFTGHYIGYIADAEELIMRANLKP